MSLYPQTRSSVDQDDIYATSHSNLVSYPDAAESGDSPSTPPPAYSPYGSDSSYVVPHTHGYNPYSAATYSTTTIEESEREPLPFYRQRIFKIVAICLVAFVLAAAIIIGVVVGITGAGEQSPSYPVVEPAPTVVAAPITAPAVAPIAAPAVAQPAAPAKSNDATYTIDNPPPGVKIMYPVKTPKVPKGNDGCLWKYQSLSTQSDPSVPPTCVCQQGRLFMTGFGCLPFTVMRKCQLDPTTKECIKTCIYPSSGERYCECKLLNWERTPWLCFRFGNVSKSEIFEQADVIAIEGL